MLNTIIINYPHIFYSLIHAPKEAENQRQSRQKKNYSLTNYYLVNKNLIKHWHVIFNHRVLTYSDINLKKFAICNITMDT